MGWRWAMAMAMAADIGGRDGVTGERGPAAAAAARVLYSAAGDERLGCREVRVSGEWAGRVCVECGRAHLEVLRRRDREHEFAVVVRHCQAARDAGQIPYAIRDSGESAGLREGGRTEGEDVAREEALDVGEGRVGRDDGVGVRGGRAVELGHVGRDFVGLRARSGGQRAHAHVHTRERREEGREGVDGEVRDGELTGVAAPASHFFLSSATSTYPRGLRLRSSTLREERGKREKRAREREREI